jgi:dTDP-4-dehydrorhamnose reductase
METEEMVDRKRVVVIGAGGMLGHDLLELLSDRYETVGVDIDRLDIREPGAVDTCVSSINPSFVINAAARTDVDGCEKDASGAYEVNATGAGNVALVCAGRGIRFVQVSTDYVFDGKKKTPYVEGDSPAPQSVYGKTKLAGEEAVKSAGGDYLIVRTSWLYGLHGKNFVGTMLRAARRNTRLEVVDDQRGCPTFTRDLAGAIGALLPVDYRGIVNVVNSGICSWYDFACEIFRIGRIENVRLERIGSGRLDRAASRPLFSALDCSLYTRLTGRTLRPWQEALKDFLARFVIESRI